MRSKWLWAALVLVAVLGITTAASATTRGLITGKQIASHTINSKHLVNHTVQAHDLSNTLIKSLHGARGATGPVGPKGLAGPRGATGATGPQGPSGVVETESFAGLVGDKLLPGPGDPGPGFVFVGPTVTVTTTSTQEFVGFAVAVFGSRQGATFDFGLCRHSDLSELTLPFAVYNWTEAEATEARLPYAASASVTPGAGTWKVGYCVRVHSPGSLDNNGNVNGWVQVVN